MAPKSVAKGTKRTVAAPAKPTEPKQARRGTARESKPKMDPMMQGIVDVVGAAPLPDSCREMLLACAPSSFAAYKGERHELQRLAVDMCGEVVEAAKAKLDEELAQATQASTALEATRSELSANVAAAERALEEALQVAQTRDDEVKQAKVAAALDAASLGEARTAQRDGDASIQKVKSDAATLQQAVDTQLTVLVEAPPETCAKDGGYVDVVQPLLPLLTLDASLVTALPSACRKPPSERGAFDKMVIDQFSSTVHNKLQQLSSELAEAAPGCQKREADVQAAAQALEAATQRMQAAEDAATHARDAADGAAKSVDAAKVALAEHAPTLDAAVQVRKAKEQELNDFINYNLSCLETLRDMERPPATQADTEASPDTELPLAPQAATEETTAPSLVASPDKGVTEALVVEPAVGLAGA